MKKLMIAACAVAFAAVANAATAEWGTDPSALLDPNGNDIGWDGNGYITMSMWSIDSATYDALNKNGADGVSAAVWTAYNASTPDASNADDGNGQVFVKDPNEYGVNDTAYAAILLTYNEGDGITHYKGNIASWTFEADMDKTSPYMDSYVYGDDTGTALGWTAVGTPTPTPTPTPEPTSGLLLLLGVAGLALRRKAK